jgi:hypothetical protein
MSLYSGARHLGDHGHPTLGGGAASSRWARETTGSPSYAKASEGILLRALTKGLSCEAR